MALSKIKNTGIADSSVTSAKIEDGTIVNADINACAAIASSKLSGIVSSCEASNIEQNIALLGFKMAVNDGLTVFNLVDGVVDEFHDESGTDEGEGSNDNYCSSNDNYLNQSADVPYSAGFGYNHRTESDTSNPATNTYSQGIFTVPTGMTSLNIQAWGAGGGSGPSAAGTPAEAVPGGGGGYAEGTFAVTGSQVLAVAIGQAGYPIHEPNESVAGTGGLGFRGAGNVGGPTPSTGPSSNQGAGGGGASGLATAGPGLPSDEAYPAVTAPEIVLVAGGGGGGGYDNTPQTATNFGGAGGGLIGDAGGQPNNEQTGIGNGGGGGGGGDQEQGGTGGASVNPPPDGSPGGFLEGGDGATGCSNTGGGGEGFYGGGGGGARGPAPSGDVRAGGGGSSYYGHPQITSGSTEEGQQSETGGATQPGYSNYCGASQGGTMGDGGTKSGNEKGGAGNGYVLLTGTAPGSTTSTTIVSNAFTASSEPSTSRIVVFQENVDSITLNTDVIASISRDGGATFTNTTLTDSGYVTGSSGQRILTGTATVSGQPSGTSMRWKLALANNTSKIHGVSLQWK